MLIGQVLKTFSHWSGVPYTSLLCVAGIFIGHFHESLGPLGVGIYEWS